MTDLGLYHMKFMVLVKASKASEAGQLPDAELVREMGKYNEELVQAGVMLAGEGLHASSKGARIRFHGNQRSVTDGPFPMTGELVSGFWLWQVKSKAEAVKWLERAPFKNDEELELRQVFDPADFAPIDPTGELMEKEEALRQRLEKK